MTHDHPTPGAKPTAMSVVEGINLTNKTSVITGATSGLGRETARALAAAGSYVIIAARDTSRLAKTTMWITERVPTARISAVTLDLTSLAQVRVAAEHIRALAPAIDILINNAGVMFTPFGRTTDGFEIQMGTNHLGHFALTQWLTPHLVAAEGARVVNLSSDAHRLSDIDLSDIHWKRARYDKFRAYSASKTANILHAVELDRRLSSSGVRGYAVHPGSVATKLARHMTADDLVAINRITAQTHSAVTTSDEFSREVVIAEVGAATQVWAATSPELADRGGIYLSDCHVTDAAPYASDVQRAKRLWPLSASACAVG